MKETKKCPSCLAGFSKEDIAGNCTCSPTPQEIRSTHGMPPAVKPFELETDAPTPHKKPECDCNGPYTCKVHDGEYVFCDNFDCFCHKPPEEKKGSDFSEFFRNATPEEKEKLMREVAYDANEEQRKVMGLPATPTSSSWESEFQSARPESTWMPEHLSAGEQESPVKFFGYKWFDGKSIHEVTDWGHIKFFISRLISSHGESEYQRGKAETAKAYGGCTSCYGKGYNTVIERMVGHGEWDIGNGDIEVDRELPRYRPCPKCNRGEQFAEVLATLKHPHDQD